MLAIVLALVAGLLVGSLSGLVGIGGGVVLIPLLVYVFRAEMHVAAGTSLAIVVPTAIMGALVHWNHGNLDLRLAFVIALGAVGGSLLGAWVGDLITGDTLKKIFALILLLISISVFLDAYNVPTPWTTDETIEVEETAV